MRLCKWLKEEGESGGGMTTPAIARFEPKLTLADRHKRRSVKFKKKSKLLG